MDVDTLYIMYKKGWIFPKVYRQIANRYHKNLSPNNLCNFKGTTTIQFL